MVVVYETKCRVTKKCYIGNTQQKLKNCMIQYFLELSDLMKKGEASDFFALHFSAHAHKVNEIRQRAYKHRNSFVPTVKPLELVDI